MKILVTGGTVFVSKSIAKFFADRGEEVFVLNRNSRPQVEHINLIECDRRNINGKLKQHHFDVVIDVTAYNAQDIDALYKELGSFDNYIFISSSAVYPDTLKLPFKEADTRGNNSFWGSYGLNKIYAENAILDKVPQAYIIRPPYLYGEYNNVYREAFVFDCAEIGAPFYVPDDGNQTLQFYYIKDLCRFIEIIINKKPQQHIYNVGDRSVTINDWVKLCYSVIGKTPELRYVTDGTEQRRYFPFYKYAYELDVSAQNSLMPDLTGLEEGLSNSYKWYRDNKTDVNTKNYIEFIKSNF